MLILEVIIALVVLITAALTLVFQHRRVEKIVTQQEAWERAQQSHLRTWQTQQERRITDLETRLTSEFQEIQQTRQRWESKDAARMEELAQEYKATTIQLRLQHELARVLRIEDTPLNTDSHGQSQPTIANWRPAMLQHADLRELDLSHRYLGHADLRGVQLAGATLFMTNLSEANLSGADLSNADLSGADLSGADLHDAILTGTNLLVTDLHNAILIGANLLGARNLTTQQLYSTTYDSTTLVDTEIDATPLRVEKVRSVSDMTLPRQEAVNPISHSLPDTPIPTSAEESAPSTVPEVPVPVATAQETAIPESADMTERESEPATQEGVEVFSSPFMQDTTSFIQHLSEPAPSSPPTTQETPVPVAVAAPELESQTEVEGFSAPHSPDETTSFVQHLSEPPPSSPPTEQETPVPVAVTAPEPEPQTEGDELSVLQSSDDTTSFVQQLSEPPPLSSLTSGDSLLDPDVADLLVDGQESKTMEGSDKVLHRQKNNGRRATKKD